MKAKRNRTVEEIVNGLSFFEEEDFNHTRDIQYIAIHCAATKSTMDVSIEDIDRWHKDRGFSGVGYHVYIKFDGSVHFGRPLKKTGAHVKGFNSRSIGICLEGGYGGVNNFTSRQMDILELVLAELKKEYPQAQIKGHRDFKGVRKSCPSFDVKDWCEKKGL